MTNDTLRAHAYRAALDAEYLWELALNRAYGKKQACDARYDSRGYATPELRAAKDGFLFAVEQYRSTGNH